MSSNPVLELANALLRDRSGLAVVYYPDHGIREWLVAEIGSIVEAGACPLVVATVEEALGVPHRLAMLIPQDEVAAVDELDGSRDRVLEPPRTWPIALFLLRGGAGQTRLASSPALASWVRGSDSDPDRAAEVDEAAEREQFQSLTGKTPEEWLQTTSGEERTSTAPQAARTYWAMLLTSA